MKFRLRVILIIILFPLIITNYAISADPPYPPSPLIQSITWDFTNFVRLAPGSDNWPMTWADDDHLYTSWGDGGGFGGSNTEGRVSLGFARIEGPPASFTTEKLWTGIGKVKGILSVDGILYAFRRVQPDNDKSQIMWSFDHGSSWNFGFILDEPDQAFLHPTFLQYGKDYQGSRDAFVYIYAGPATGSTINTEAYMARVPKDQVTDRTAYEFLKGIGTDGNPIWTTDIRQRGAVFTDQNGVGDVVSVHYISGLSRYIMAAPRLYSTSAWGIFDAPEPWGPWTAVAYYNEGKWMDSDTKFAFYFPTKWMSADGKTLWMVFTGTGEYDSFNLIKATLTLDDDIIGQGGSPPAVPTGLNIMNVQ